MHKKLITLLDITLTVGMVVLIAYMYIAIHHNSNDVLKQQLREEKLKREKQEKDNRKKEYEIQRLREDVRFTAESMLREFYGKIKQDEIIIPIPEIPLQDIPLIWEEKPKIFNQEPASENKREKQSDTSIELESI